MFQYLGATDRARPAAYETGTARTRAAEQGQPRSEGCVPLPALRSNARAGGRPEGTQGGVVSSHSGRGQPMRVRRSCRAASTKGHMKR